MNKNLSLSINTYPSEINFKNLSNLQISISATNNSNQTFNPELHLTNLYVNGEKSIHFMLTVSNGIREANWYKLSPKETTSMSWSSIGLQLFPEPGEYILQLKLKDIESEKVKVKVLDK